jgi:putative glutamine amidotransferase
MSLSIAVAFFREDRVGPYLDAMTAAGASPAELSPVSPARLGERSARQALAGASGLLLTGGCDLQPCLYGEARLPAAGVDAPQLGRDQLEWDLLADAQARRLPVFGVCRGHQLLHVFLGGSLYQDVALQVPGSTPHRFYADEGWPVDHLAHEVAVRQHDHPMTRALAAGGRLEVNSRHHQAVRALGQGMRVAALAPDGLVEASFWEGPEWWARTVQWHPENLVHLPVHLQLFRDFLAAAREHAAAGVAAGSATAVEAAR